MTFRHEKLQSGEDGAADSKAHDDGFTIVELLVVLVIIGLIAGLALPRVLRYLGSARTDTAQTQIRNIESAMELYYIDNRSYPPKSEGIAALSKKPGGADNWNGPYMKNADTLLDPWNRPYIYDHDESSGVISIVSFGRDGKKGGEDEDKDISN